MSIYAATAYSGQQGFCPMRKNVCFWCIFGCWIQICFQNFSITHTFRSRLKGCNLLCQHTKVCFYHARHEEFMDFLSQEDGFMFCNDVCSVMGVLVHEYNTDQWRLFINLSKVSLKLVLLHNGNRFPSVPLAHAANIKESYERIWKSLSMANLSGRYVVISSLWHCYSEYNSGTQNPAVSCAIWSARTRRITV